MSWKKLKPEDKVRVAIEMVDVATRISADNEREESEDLGIRTDFPFAAEIRARQEISLKVRCTGNLFSFR